MRIHPVSWIVWVVSRAGKILLGDCAVSQTDLVLHFSSVCVHGHQSARSGSHFGSSQSHKKIALSLSTGILSQ